jgi:hypothetical protein
MSVHELTAVLTHRHSVYALLLVALGLTAAFVYLFNYTTFFGAVTP